MEIAVKTLFMGLNLEITSHKKILAFHGGVPKYHRTRLSVHMTNSAHENSRSLIFVVQRRHKYFSAVHAMSPGLENQDVTTSPFKDFSVAVNIVKDREIKLRVDVSGAKTQATFDDAFSKLVAAAQPIPGFRRVKGGKTPNIPKDVLLHIIGHSKVNQESIRGIINSTVAEYVKKEGLKVTKDLKVEQSFEELEATFVPGKEFRFDALIQLKETDAAKC